MPLYEYRCQKCGHQLEARQKISDAPLLTCPNCGTDALERLVSQSSFALKGSGWYADGYGAKESKTAADAKSSETKTETTKTESKPAESKPAESKPTDSKPATETKSTPKPKDSGD